MTFKPTKRKPLRILFTCAGRRVELIRAFRSAAASLRCPVELHGTDANPLAPALFHTDARHHLPLVAKRTFKPALLELVKRRQIHLLVPLSDIELEAVARLAPRLADMNCTPLISTPETIRISRDKIETHRVLEEADIDTPKTWRWNDPRLPRRFPLYMKPRFGSASAGNHVIHNARELAVLGRRVEEALVQEFARGVEHTLDVYTGLDGIPRCVVPRRRLEVRAGEVSKSLVVKDRAIMAMGRRVAEALPGCRGVVTVQCMVDRRRIQVIEINARFGGGCPLAIHAGADFPRWILQEHLGTRPRIRANGFRDDMVMLRYDDSVFVPNGSRLLEKKRP